MLRSKSAESEGVTTLSENSQIAESREANSSINIGREGGLSIIVKIVTVKITSFCIYIYRHLENGKYKIMFVGTADMLQKIKVFLL